MSNNHLSSQKNASRNHSRSLSFYLLPEESEWGYWGDEMFVFQKSDRKTSKPQQPEPNTNLSFLILSTIFLILVTATWAKASPEDNKIKPTAINSTTELIQLITNFE